MKASRLMATFALLAAACFSLSATAEVDGGLPSYKKVSGVSGNLSSVGSDTLANLMTMWVEHFKGDYPSVNVQVQAAGSGTAPPALTEGTSNLGPMSRPMTPTEIQAFQNKYGYPPVAVPVAVDALAVFVHKDNPIKSLSLDQVDAIFSSTRLCGAAKGATTWGDVGLKGDWAKRPIQLFGRNSVSGTNGYFKEVALCKGDYKPNVNEQPGSAAVVGSVSNTINAIGYSGIGYRTSSVRIVPLAEQKGGEVEEASEQNALSGKYPLARFLYIYVNKAPNKPLNPLEAEFLKTVLSKEGQQIVTKDGFIPLPKKVVDNAHKQLGI